MATQAPKKIARRKASTNGAYVKAANKLLEFAVNEVQYYPEPEEMLDDERVESDNMEMDFMDHMFRRALINDTVAFKDPTLKCLNEMNTLLPGIVEKVVRRSNSISRRSEWEFTMNNWWYSGYIDRNNLPNQTEEYKHQLVRKLSLAWYLNARRFIYRSLDMRKPIMEDKRYKIGFLFHALRMNVFDQHKLFQGMQQQEGNKNLRNFETTFLVYTKILRMNVDLNDIISYLRLLHYNQPDPYLKSTWDYEHKRDPNNKKYVVVKKKKNNNWKLRFQECFI